MAYARHQSFYLRNKWLSKGMKAIKKDPRFFYDSFAFEKIGLGKNMVQSLKFWLLATGLAEEAEENKQKIHKLTYLGDLIFENDRLLQLNDTVSILHYNLVRNKYDYSTVFEWFFNIYQETSSTREEMLSAFTYWVDNREIKKISEKSLKSDIDCLIQLYTKEADEEDPEDVIFSPFTKLNLLKEQKSAETHYKIRKISPDFKQISLSALYYVLISYCEERNINILSVDEIINGEYLWGKVFNLSRTNVIEALNVLTVHDTYPLQYIRTNNLDNVLIPKISSIEFLQSEYANKKEEGSYGI
jgi:hypothetical protein